MKKVDAHETSEWAEMLIEFCNAVQFRASILYDIISVVHTAQGCAFWPLIIIFYGKLHT